MESSTPNIAVSVEPMMESDWPSVRTIYLEGINTGNATFENSAPEWEQWNAGHMQKCRLVARQKNTDKVLGWAALSPVSSRCVYAGVAEMSIYVASHARGQGVGSTLMERLVDASEQAGLWTLQAGIFPENAASISLHQTFGFRIVGTRERIGCMDGRWRDVVLMERRSTIVAAE